MKIIFHVMRHELRQILREPKYLLPYFFPPFLLICSLFFILENASSETIPFTMLLCALLLSPMAVPLASDSFAGERERGSLELLQLLPGNSSFIFYGKLLALIPIPLFFLLLSETIFAGMLSGNAFSFWIKSVWAGFCMTILFSSIALFVSLSVKTARAANQISLLFFFALFIIFQFFAERYFSIDFASLGLSIFTFVACAILTRIAYRKFRSDL